MAENKLNKQKIRSGSNNYDNLINYAIVLDEKILRQSICILRIPINHETLDYWCGSNISGGHKSPSS
jgi:hypothetical protein